MRFLVKHAKRTRYVVGVALFCCAFIGVSPAVSAQVDYNPPGPNGGSYALVSSKTAPPPTEGARIVSPSTGQSFSEQPVRVSGICPKGLLVKILVNDAMAGSMYCEDGSFSLDVTLVTGTNDIFAYVYDDLDQEGPVSNTVSVTFNNARFSAFGTLITLTSPYARRAAAPGSVLTWPLILSGGRGPYAFSIDWGDNTTPQLKSHPVAGNLDIQHTYKNAGIYQIVVKVTDADGVSAFLQLTAVATGDPKGGVTVDEGSGSTTITIVRVLWQPVLVAFLLLPVAFWLGRRYELSELRKQIERDAEKYTS